MFGDDPRGLDGSEQRAVHDAGQASALQLFAERLSLRPPQRAQAKAVEVPIEDVVRVFDLRVPD
jgi:hypothetical protein